MQEVNKELEKEFHVFCAVDQEKGRSAVYTTNNFVLDEDGAECEFIFEWDNDDETMNLNKAVNIIGAVISAHERTGLVIGVARRLIVRSDVNDPSTAVLVVAFEPFEGFDVRKRVFEQDHPGAIDYAYQLSKEYRIYKLDLQLDSDYLDGGDEDAGESDESHE